MPFTSLGLSSQLLDALKQQKYQKPFPIQEQAIPAILKGRDVLGVAKTGSGKTASYVLPILNQLERRTYTKDRNVNVLVLVPTRELADQVNQVFQTLSSGFDDQVKSMAVYGGVSINPQMKALYGINVLVATPGRLIELQASNALKLNKVEILVIDEADKMLNLGFEEEMTKILSLLPAMRQNLLFSATLNSKVDDIKKVMLNNPLLIEIEQKTEEKELINQVAYMVAEEKKGPLLRYLIKENDLHEVLVFASSIYKADNIANKLRKNGIDAKSIHGKKSQKSRRDALRDFKSGALRVLVATDLLSRGIDIEYLPCVINYELPRSPKDYIHRIGRTGRAEETGEAISLIMPAEEHHFKVIQKKMKRYVERVDANDFDLKGY